MKTLLFFTLFISGLFCAQEKFEIDSKNYFTRIVITEIENTRKEIIFKKTKEWISKNFMSDDVLKTQIENEFIRMEGISKNNFCYKVLGMKVCTDSKYIIEFSFKDNKYKMDIIDWQTYTPAASTSIPKWYNIPLENIFKKDGTLRPSMADYYPDYITFLNDLNSSLKSYILKTQSENDW